MRLRLWSIVELAGFAMIAIGIGAKTDVAWGVIAGGLLLAVWAGINEIGGVK